MANDDDLSDVKRAMIAQIEAMEDDDSSGEDTITGTSWPPHPVYPGLNNSIVFPLATLATAPTVVPTHLPLPNTDFLRFSHIPPELQRKVWKTACSTEMASGKGVRLDKPNSKSIPLLSAMVLARTVVEKNYDIFLQTGVFNVVPMGPVYSIYVNYTADTILLIDTHRQYPIDRGVALYANWLSPVEQVALNARNFPLTEYMPGQGQSMPTFWSKLTQACPLLRKITIFDFDGVRSTDANADHQPPIGGFSYISWFVFNSWTAERLAGRLFDIDLERKVFLDG